jgi:uncharacterized protein (DUF983 family)
VTTETYRGECPACRALIAFEYEPWASMELACAACGTQLEFYEETETQCLVLAKPDTAGGTP